MLVYQRSASFVLGRVPRTDENNVNYSNPDNDPKGDWRSGDVRSPNYRENLRYKIGVHEGRAIYLLYNGILDDLAIDSGNVLTGVVLDKLPKHDGPRVIYAAAFRLGAPRLQREGIVFKQTPYALEVAP